MITVTKLFMSLIKMTVLAHYLTFQLLLQWQNVYFYKKEAGKFYFACFHQIQLLRSLFELIEV